MLLFYTEIQKSTDTSLWRHTTTRLANRTMPSPYKGFLWRENKEAMFWSFHPLAHKTYNEHLPKPFFKAIRKSLYVDKPKPGDNKQVFKFLNGLESKFIYG